MLFSHYKQCVSFQIHRNRLEHPDTPHAQFAVLVTASSIFDIVWMARNGQNWFIRALTIIILILKVRQAFGDVSILPTIHPCRSLPPSRSLPLYASVALSFLDSVSREII